MPKANSQPTQIMSYSTPPRTNTAQFLKVPMSQKIRDQGALVTKLGGGKGKSR